MKRLCLVLGIFLTSFFLFSSNVRADMSYTTTLDSSVFDYLDNLSDMISTSESFLAQHSEYSSRYFLTYAVNLGRYYLNVFPNAANPYYENFNNTNIRFTGFISRTMYEFSSDFSTVSLGYSNQLSINGVNTYDFSIILYLNFDTDLRNAIITVNYDNNVYQSSTHFPSVYDLAVEFGIYNPPSPSDSTPILSSFYTILVEKIGWFTEELVGNYVYISIFGVFILIFLIELLRRYFL